VLAADVRDALGLPDGDECDAARLPDGAADAVGGVLSQLLRPRTSSTRGPEQRSHGARESAGSASAGRDADGTECRSGGSGGSARSDRLKFSPAIPAQSSIPDLVSSDVERRPPALSPRHGSISNFDIKEILIMKRTIAYLSLAAVLAVTAMAQTSGFTKVMYCKACCHGTCGKTCCKSGCTDSCCQSK
jgi:hypothetical protein